MIGYNNASVYKWIECKDYDELDQFVCIAMYDTQVSHCPCINLMFL